MAKNKMRRCLLALLDPHPSATQIAELWAYFGSECAYCGTTLNRPARNGHLDHVVSSAMGGSNDVHNHVLACGRCNGDEKREESWQTFLARKVRTPSIATERKARIEQWLSLGRVTTKKSEKAQAVIDGALRNFDSAVAQIRALRKSGA